MRYPSCSEVCARVDCAQFVVRCARLGPLGGDACRPTDEGAPAMPGADRHPMTLTQKVLAHHALGLTRPYVEAGDTLRVRVDWTIASELAWNGMDRTYTLLGRPALANPDHFYLALDHTVDPVTLAQDPRARKLADLSRE